jgi:hypothetical protein
MTDYEFPLVWLYYKDSEGDGDNEWHYSTDWSRGGPIIEREFISLVNAAGDDVWSAYPIADDPIAHRKSGPTPLIAGMRCYVDSQLGEIVEIPKELLC